MKGIFHFEVSNKKQFYSFDVKRNITILEGNSATGKTTLLEILQDSKTIEKKHTCKVITNANYFVYLRSDQSRNWLEVFEGLYDTIIFIEENNRFIYSVEFAEYVALSGNYFVIVSRNSIKTLPYSFQEIYKIESSKKGLQQVYTFKEVYSNFPEINSNIDLIITEDSKSDYQFYSHFFNQVEVISAGGAANILNELISAKAKNILCIVDGAAFGSLISDCYEFLESDFDKRITFYLPESFEWVLLKAGVISFGNLTQILENPSDYIECKEYVSWERYFTHLAEEYSDSKWKYTKGTLHQFYYNKHNQEKVKDIMPEELKRLSNLKIMDFKSDNNKMSLF